MPEPARSAFSYAIVRVVPRIERGERINAGVILHCRRRDFLAARVGLDEARLALLDPGLDAAAVRVALEAIAAVAAGDAAAGAIAALPAWERYDWLVAPSSTVIQASRTHTGLTADPLRTLEALYAELVEPVSRS